MATTPNDDDLTRSLPTMQAAPMTYGQQMSAVGNALLGVLGGAGRFITNAPGSGGPLDRLVGGLAAPNASQAATVLPAAQAAVTPTPTPAATTPPAVKAANAPTNAAAAPPPVAPLTPRRAPGGGGAATATGPALIPGETGYYNQNNQLVPYGVDLGANGSFGPTAAAAARGGYAPGAEGKMPGMPAGAGNLIDPRMYFPSMVQAQMDYANAAANSILNKAGDGSELGYSARLRALSAIYNNGLAQVGQGGGNTFNAGISNILGSEASAGATLGAAGIQASTASADRAAQRELQEFMFKNTAQNMGSITTPTGPGGMPVTVTTTGMPNGTGGLNPTRPQQERAKPKEGATQVFNGTTYTYANGNWKAQ